MANSKKKASAEAPENVEVTSVPAAESANAEAAPVAKPAKKTRAARKPKATKEKTEAAKTEAPAAAEEKVPAAESLAAPEVKPAPKKRTPKAAAEKKPAAAKRTTKAAAEKKPAAAEKKPAAGRKKKAAEPVTNITVAEAVKAKVGKQRPKVDFATEIEFKDLPQSEGDRTVANKIYIEIKDGKVRVEPYDYGNEPLKVVVESADAFMKLLKKPDGFVKAVKDGTIDMYGKSLKYMYILKNLLF